MNVNEVLTVNETARLLRVSRSTLYGMWERREGPPFTRVGARRRVFRDDLETWRKARSASA